MSLNSNNPLKRTKTADIPKNRTYINQPNSITFGIYSFSKLQACALMVVTEELQQIINRSIADKTSNKTTQLTLFSGYEFNNDKLVLEILLKKFGVKASNYQELKEQLRQMSTIPIELGIGDDDGKSYTKFSNLFDVIIENPVSYTKEDGSVVKSRIKSIKIEIDKVICAKLVDITRGFTRYMKEIAFNTKGKYTFRIYWLICAMKNRGGFTISLNKLRKMLDISSNRYLRYTDFHKRVIRPAYEELHEKSDVWFEMSEEKRAKGIFLTFKVIAEKIDDVNFLTRKKNLLEMLQKHFDVKNNDLKEIESMVSQHNIESYYNTLTTVFEYVSMGKVVNKTEYILAALKKEIMPNI